MERTKRIGLVLAAGAVALAGLVWSGPSATSQGGGGSSPPASVEEAGRANGVNGGIQLAASGITGGVDLYEA